MSEIAEEVVTALSAVDASEDVPAAADAKADAKAVTETQTTAEEAESVKLVAQSTAAAAPVVPAMDGRLEAGDIPGGAPVELPRLDPSEVELLLVTLFGDDDVSTPGPTGCTGTEPGPGAPGPGPGSDSNVVSGNAAGDVASVKGLVDQQEVSVVDGHKAGSEEMMAFVKK